MSAEAMEGLGIFGDLPQLAHDDRVNPFGDLPQFDPLPAVGSNHAQALQTRDDRFDIFGDLPQLDPLPAVKNCSSTAVPAVGGNMLKRTRSRQADVFSMQPFSCRCSDVASQSHRKVGGKSKRKHEMLREQQVGEQIDSLAQLAGFAQGCKTLW